MAPREPAALTGKPYRLAFVVPGDTHTRLLALALARTKPAAQVDHLDVAREALLVGLRAMEEGAQPDPPRGVTALVRRATDPASGQAPLFALAPRPETPVEIGWRTWRAAYAARYGVATYHKTAREGPAMNRLAAMALDTVSACGLSGDVALESLYVHMWRAYFELPGHDDFLRLGKHRLEWIEREANKLGTPWDKGSRKTAASVGISEARPVTGQYVGRPR